MGAWGWWVQVPPTPASPGLPHLAGALLIQPLPVFRQYTHFAGVADIPGCVHPRTAFQIGSSLVAVPFWRPQGFGASHVPHTFQGLTVRAPTPQSANVPSTLAGWLPSHHHHAKATNAHPSSHNRHMTAFRCQMQSTHTSLPPQKHASEARHTPQSLLLPPSAPPYIHTQQTSSMQRRFITHPLAKIPCCVDRHTHARHTQHTYSTHTCNTQHTYTHMNKSLRSLNPSSCPLVLCQSKSDPTHSHGHTHLLASLLHIPDAHSAILRHSTCYQAAAVTRALHAAATV